MDFKKYLTSIIKVSPSNHNLESINLIEYFKRLHVTFSKRKTSQKINEFVYQSKIIQSKSKNININVC